MKYTKPIIGLINLPLGRVVCRVRFVCDNNWSCSSFSCSKSYTNK
ncbi:hypothetical protein F170042I7_23500 [Blautia caecimuris]